MMPISPEASSLLQSTKVTDQHRGRGAVVYVRQSTTKQVQQHRESQQNQYGLVQRALGLGWVPERVRVIDADQGSSGQDGQRPGFRELVAEVSLGRVGLILAYEASRLARSNADWYALLDLAALVGALIAAARTLPDLESAGGYIAVVVVLLATGALLLRALRPQVQPPYSGAVNGSPWYLAGGPASSISAAKRSASSWGS